MKNTKGSQDSRFVFLQKIHQLNKQKPPCFSRQLIWNLCPPVPPAPSLLAATKAFSPDIQYICSIKRPFSLYSCIWAALRGSEAQPTCRNIKPKRTESCFTWEGFILHTALFSEGSDHFHWALRNWHFWQDVSGLKPNQRLLIFCRVLKCYFIDKKTPHALYFCNYPPLPQQKWKLSFFFSVSSKREGLKHETNDESLIRCW